MTTFAPFISSTHCTLKPRLWQLTASIVCDRQHNARPLNTPISVLACARRVHGVVWTCQGIKPEAAAWPAAPPPCPASHRSPASVCVIEPTWAISENACLSRSRRQVAPPGRARPDDEGIRGWHPIDLMPATLSQSVGNSSGWRCQQLLCSSDGKRVVKGRDGFPASQGVKEQLSGLPAASETPGSTC